MEMLSIVAGTAKMLFAFQMFFTSNSVVRLLSLGEKALDIDSFIEKINITARRR